MTWSADLQSAPAAKVFGTSGLLPMTPSVLPAPARNAGGFAYTITDIT